MRISDEECYKIARKLRWPKDSLLAYPDEELIRLRSVVECQYKQDLYERLADLIDPRRETTEDVSESYGEFECKACGCRINDVTAVDYGGINFCPDCGREVINDN